MATNKVVSAEKLDNGYWIITIIDPDNQKPKVLLDLQFYRVSNRDINLKNYIYADIDNSNLYFNKSYTPKFIAQLIYLYSGFAYTNGILDKDILKIEKELTKQGLTLSKYGLSKINDKTIYPCLNIDPYPDNLKFKCLSDDGKITEKYTPLLSNYLFIKDIVNLGETEITVNLWNFAYIVFGGVAFFMIVFLFTMRIDKN
jgi:hypothetical protein